MTDTFYQVLGVPEDASTDEIRSAYRERAREVHPDRNDDPRATERMKRLNRARDVLTDGSERERYDRLGHHAYVDAGRSGTGNGSPDGPEAGGDSRGTHGDRSATTGGSNAGGRSSTAGGSNTGANQGGAAWNPWGDPFGDDGPLGGDPFDGEASFAGDPFDDDGPFGGDPFDQDGPFGAGAPFGGTGTGDAWNGGDPGGFDRGDAFGESGEWDWPTGGVGNETTGGMGATTSGGVGAGTPGEATAGSAWTGSTPGAGPTDGARGRDSNSGGPGGRSTGRTAGDGPGGTVHRGTGDDPGDGWVGDYRDRRGTDTDRSRTGQEVEWSDGGEDRRVSPGLATLLADRIRPRSPDSTVARAWAVRVVASAVLAGTSVVTLGTLAGPVGSTTTLLASLSCVLVAFLGHEVVVDRSPVGPDFPGGRTARSGSPPGSDDGKASTRSWWDGDASSRPDRRHERAVLVAVGTNALAAALMLLGAVRGGDWFGLAYAGRVTVQAVVLFLVVAPTAGMATGTLVASVLGAVLGRWSGDALDGVTSVGLASGILFASAGAAAVFFTRLGGRRGSVREPLGGGASAPWIPAVEAGPLYLGGTLEFVVGVALLGCLAVSWLLFLGVAAGLPRRDRCERGYRVRPLLWDLAVALPVASLAWAWLADVRTVEFPQVPSIVPVPPASLPWELPPLTGTIHVEWVLFAVLSLPALLGASYLVRRRIERLLWPPSA